MKKALAFASLVAAATPPVSSRRLGGFVDEIVDVLTSSSTEPPVTPLIVGGSDVTTGEYDFFVQGEGCGGSLVAPDVVLTAAHCETAFAGSTVIVGNYKWGEVTDGAQQLAIESGMYIHPDYYYSLTGLRNDLMLFKIEPSTLLPIDLNADSDIPADNQDLTVIGFGALYDGGYIHDTLQETTVQAMSHEECSTETLLADYDVDETSMLCASVDDASTDSCYGDSGGPLFVEGTRTLVGVVSWGLGCAMPNSPTVYARVSGNVEWIQQTICQLTDTSPSFCEGLPPTTLPPVPPPASAPADDDDFLYGDDWNQGTDDTSQGTDDWYGTDDTSQGTDDFNQGTDDTSQGTDDLYGTDDFTGADDDSAGDDAPAQGDDAAAADDDQQGGGWFDDDFWDFLRDGSGGRK